MLCGGGGEGGIIFVEQAVGSGILSMPFFKEDKIEQCQDSELYNKFESPSVTMPATPLISSCGSSILQLSVICDSDEGEMRRKSKDCSS